MKYNILYLIISVALFVSAGGCNKATPAYATTDGFEQLSAALDVALAESTASRNRDYESRAHRQEHRVRDQSYADHDHRSNAGRQEPGPYPSEFTQPRSEYLSETQELTAAIDEMRHECAMLRGELTMLTQSLAAARGELQQLNFEIDERKSQLAQLQSQIAQAEQELKKERNTRQQTIIAPAVTFARIDRIPVQSRTDSPTVCSCRKCRRRSR